MLKSIRNKKGELAMITIIGLATVAGLLAPAVVSNTVSGRFKKHGKTIWCKMQNKGNDYCDIKYNN